MRYIFSFILICISILKVAAYDRPNSIALKPNSSNYYITNTSGKSITQLDSNFDKKDVITGLKKPKDIIFATFGIYKGLLILDSNEVKVYDADGFSFITSFKVKGAIELEDAEIDKTVQGTFYISDPLAHKIFKVVIGPAPFYTPTFTELNNTLRNPKALLFDSKNRLLVTTDTVNSSVYQINTSSGSASLVAQMGIDYVNSLEEDLQNNYYATSWGDNYFYRLDNDFKNKKDLGLYNKPTGLCFNPAYDIMVLACSNCNKIEFHKLHMVYINDVDSVNCARDSFNVNINIQFKGKGTYNSSNTFYLELSDGQGKFSSGSIIGSIKSQTEPTGYRVVLPKGFKYTGSNYKVRVRSTSPAFTSINEVDIYIPYSPSGAIFSSDTVLFCNPSKLKFGLQKDKDSGWVKFEWYSNGNVLSHNLPNYESIFTTQTKLYLIKRSLTSVCVTKDSIQLIPSSTITIPFKDTLKACEQSYIYPGGDSIYKSKIEWTSSVYPTINTSFNPKYILTTNDTFTVKVTSLAGSCFSQKKIYAFVKPRPKFELNTDTFKVCSSIPLIVSPNYLKGDKQNLDYKWHPSNYLKDTVLSEALFANSKPGFYTYRFIANDRVYTCGDTLIIKIRSVEQPSKPILSKNSKGVVITNFDSKLDYQWFKNSKLISQPVKDSQFVVPNGDTPWGEYKVIASMKDGIECSDTSVVFKLDEPISILWQKTFLLEIYPNPAKQFIFMSNLPLKGEGEVLIYSSLGQIVKQQKIRSEEIINISDIFSGIYLIQFNFEGRNYKGRFIKE